jgi:hypothetical protein
LQQLSDSGISYYDAGKLRLPFRRYDFRLAARLGVAQPLATAPSGAARRPQFYAALGSDF